jgi:hypothetical protein
MEFVAEEGHAMRFSGGLEICLTADCPIVEVKEGDTRTNVESGAVMRGIVVEGVRFSFKCVLLRNRFYFVKCLLVVYVMHK